jgi:light-regulated signal transduction histidine kinase (bacteriophytochrome)
MTPQDIAVPEDAQSFPEHMQQLARDQQIVFEAQHLRQDGTTVPVEVSSRHIEYDGQPAILSTARDITERQETAQRIEQYADDLARSNKELEQFAYVVSHDLQEPARMVSSYLDLIARRYRGEIDEKADGYIHYAVDGAERMQEMIRALLNLSRVETRGKAFAPTDVETIVERTLTILDRAIEESSAKITYTDLPTVQADRTQLAQVFQNLIANAIKFRREDVAPHVHISARREDGAWRFAIADNGIGINPGQADRIFQIFQRLHTREEYPGTGIGLALARKIVERHGGRLWMESVPGEGSTFYFTVADSAS